MNQNTLLLRIAAVISLATIPVILWFATEAVPPMATIRIEEHGNRMGPWVFTWGLVWLAVIAALLVACVCYLSAKALQASDSH